MVTYLDNTLPNLTTLDLAITVKHILLHDVSNACQRADNFGKQKKIIMHKIAKLTWYNKPHVEEAQWQIFCKHTLTISYTATIIHFYSYMMCELRKELRYQRNRGRKKEVFPFHHTKKMHLTSS